MKKKIFLLLSISSIMFFSCEKEDQFDNLVHDKYFRIKKVTEITDKIYQKRYVFTYNGENLVKYENHWLAGNNWKEYSIQEITYNGSNANLTEHSEGSKIRKTDYTINNNLTTEFLSYYYSNNHWEKGFKRNYKYSGGNLTEYSSQLFVNGGTQNTEKGIFLYDKNQIKSLIIYVYENGEWNEFRKDTFLYSNNNMVGVINYSRSTASWENNYKVDYTYSGDNISEAKIYFHQWNGTSVDWKLSDTRKYQYDNQGLITKENIIAETYSTEFIYEYEEGKGNAMQLYFNPEERVWKKSIFKLGPNF